VCLQSLRNVMQLREQGRFDAGFTFEGQAEHGDEEWCENSNKLLFGQVRLQA
jgi:hypothetical protein